MNRASMLRLAALVVIGLGAALLTAAMLLSYYTTGKIKKLSVSVSHALPPRIQSGSTSPSAR